MSGSPRSEHFDDIYFAVEDGLEETKHVFLAGNGLPERWQNMDSDHPRFVIAETGFGTGLNFLTVWQSFEAHARPEQTLEFISFERYPLSAAQIKEYLSVWSDKIGPYLDRLVEVYPLRVTGWHKIQVTARVSLLLIFDDVNRAMPDLNTTVDAWFLDGHAPAKNPDMWSPTVFEGIARTSDEGTTFATFTAAGLVKRGMRDAGFTVEKTRGFGRKRDMLVGTYAASNPNRIIVKPKALIKSVGIIGGGLAGTAMAHALKVRGITAEIFEKDHVGAGASGNALGLFNPRFSAQRGPESDFYGSAYALAERTFKSLPNIGYHPCGSLHLVTDEDKRKRFTGLIENWGWHSEHAKVISSDEATQIAGIHLEQDALHLPESGSVSPALVCEALAQGTPLHSESVETITASDAGWLLNGRRYDAVVIASGADCLRYEQVADLPLHTVRGQITYAKATELSGTLKTNLCFGGYCSTSVQHEHAIGSTFQPWLTETIIREEDHVQILSQLETAVPALRGQFVPAGGRAALRTASKDRVPVIGAVSGFDTLYISSAHGSHGLLSSLLAAEVIAADMTGETPVLPQSALRHVSPVRFVERARKKAG